MEEVYNNTLEPYFKKPLLKNIYFTTIGILLVIVYLLTKNRIIGLIAFNINIAILLSTEFLRWEKGELYDCFIKYLKSGVKPDLSNDFITKCFVLGHYVGPMILFYNMRKFLRIPINLQLYYSLLSFLVFISWTCITNDCVSMQNIYFSYDDSACKHKISKKLNVKIIFIMLFGNFLIPLISLIKQSKK